ncbi:Imm21 family immunity protein [Micromonospora sp. NPDC085948]|uniref:Imm21 family immunity protein n=1 Tax=Micromonospora sp. NPDC085948 TaxID=3155293 RepID=UPI00341605E4
MSDLARTGRPESRLPWIESGGGPLVVVPSSALTDWQGAISGSGDPNTWDDYDRACRIDGYAGTVAVGDAEALVLGDEPATTTYLPDRRIFVRWIYAPSEVDVIRLVPRAVEVARWEDAGTWTTSGPARLFDAAYAGDELAHEPHLTIDVAAGTYLIRTAYVDPERGTALVLVQLVEPPPSA